MKKLLCALFQAVCLLLVATGSLGAMIASFVVIAMLIAWYQEGTLPSTDLHVLASASEWLLGCCVLVSVAWWLRGRTVTNKALDASFKLVPCEFGRMEKLAQEISEIAVFLYAALRLWHLVPGSAATKIPTVLGWLAVGFLGMHARILFHELGHLITARLAGLDLRKIQIGSGPLLWSRSLANGLRCEWRASSQGGFLLATPRSTEGFKWRQSLFVVGGPVADLFILWLTLQLISLAFGGLGAAFKQGPAGMMVSLLFWWTALSAMGGLVPRTVWLGENKLWSDGYWLLRLWTGSNQRVAELASKSEWSRSLDLIESSHPRSAMFLEPTNPKLEQTAGSPTFREQQALIASQLLPKFREDGLNP